MLKQLGGTQNEVNKALALAATLKAARQPLRQVLAAVLSATQSPSPRVQTQADALAGVVRGVQADLERLITETDAHTRGRGELRAALLADDIQRVREKLMRRR